MASDETKHTEIQEIDRLWDETYQVARATDNRLAAIEALERRLGLRGASPKMSLDIETASLGEGTLPKKIEPVELETVRFSVVKSDVMTTESKLQYEEACASMNASLIEYSEANPTKTVDIPLLMKVYSLLCIGHEDS